MRDVDALARLLLRHLVEDLVVHRVSLALRLPFAVELAFERHHGDLHVLLPLVHLEQIGLQLAVGSEGALQLVLDAGELALLLESLVVELVDLQRQLLVLLEQLLGVFAVLAHLTRLQQRIQLQTRAWVRAQQWRLWRLGARGLAGGLSQVVRGQLMSAARGESRALLRVLLR